MKNLTFSLLTFLIVLVTLQGCDKANPGPFMGKLIASKDTVSAGQPDSLIVVGAEADSVLWSVSPTGFHTIIKSKNKARVTFNKKGSYVVSATVNGAAPLTKNITVLDSVITPPASTTTIVPLTGNEIILKPRYHQSADSTYIYLDAVTKNQLSCTAIKLITVNYRTGNDFIVWFYNAAVQGGAGCNIGGDRYAKGTVSLFQSHNSGSFLAAGTYPLKISLLGVDYNGSFTVSASSITFNWPHTAGITLSPTTINR